MVRRGPGDCRPSLPGSWCGGRLSQVTASWCFSQRPRQGPGGAGTSGQLPQRRDLKPARHAPGRGPPGPEGRALRHLRASCPGALGPTPPLGAGSSTTLPISSCIVAVGSWPWEVRGQRVARTSSLPRAVPVRQRDAPERGPSHATLARKVAVGHRAGR